METPIQKALRITDGPVEMARRCDLVYQDVQYWVKAKRVPSHHCLKVEQATGGQVTRYDLRPDVFGEAPEKAA